MKKRQIKHYLAFIDSAIKDLEQELEHASCAGEYLELEHELGETISLRDFLRIHFKDFLKDGYFYIKEGENEEND